MKYVIRLDDITEGTNWKNFEMLEEVFDKYNIKPVLGVVPDNKDYEIMDNNYRISREKFFLKIRELQNKKYTISMHGVNHILKKAQNVSIVNINNYGEMIDLKYSQKLNNIEYGKQILNKEGIVTGVYMPPAHWIDKDTLKALKTSGFKYITDGLFAFPRNMDGITFIPQQLWRPRKICLPGIFTICLHINGMNENEINHVKRFIVNNFKNFVSFESIVFTKYNNRIFDIYNFIFKIFFISALKIKKILK